MTLFKTFPWGRIVIVACVIIVLLALYHFQFELLQQAEFKIIDAKFKFRGALKPDNPITLIAIDRKSIKELGKWPWDRRVIAQMIRDISQRGPAVIGLDLLFSSPDRNRDADEELEKAIEDSGKVVISCFFNFSSSEITIQPREEFERTLGLLSAFRIPLITNISTREVESKVPEAVEADANIPAVSEIIAGCGSYNVCQERDGRVRRIPLIVRAGGNFYPHFSAAVLKERFGVDNLRLVLKGAHPLFLEIGSLRIPMDSSGEVFVNYYGPARTFETYSASTLISGKLPERAIRGRIVLVGGTSANDFQMLHTPFEPQLSSIELMATCIDNMLCARALVESPWTIEFTVACIIGFPILLCLFMPRRGRTLVGLGIALLFFTVFLAFNLYLFSAANMQMNTTYPLLAIFASYLGILLHTSISHERRSSRLIRSVNEVGLAISSILNINELLPKILESMMRAVEVNRGMLLTCNGGGEENRNLRLVCQQNMPVAGIESEIFTYVRQIISRVCTERKSIIIGDVSSSDIDVNGVNRADLPTSIFCVPLGHGGKSLVGIVYMEKTSRGDDLWDEDIRFIDSMATQAAIAIENASMYSSLQKEEEKLREEVIHLKREVGETQRASYIVGKSKALTECLQLVERAASSDITVLVEGETGTGKELIAKAIHFTGPRKDKLFIAQNCSALPESLLESELFGHKKGAFTGAVQDKKGLFELADGGTIFLDEVADMSPVLQAKLLRVLQEGMIRPVGDVREKRVNLRIISATNKDLAEGVKAGRFREDLYYRLNAFTIKVPPLRDRREDIPLLVMQFVERIKDQLKKNITGITKDAMARLVAYDFPGNVRELENEIEKAVVMTTDGEAITSAVLSEKITGAAAAAEVLGERAPKDLHLKDAIAILEKEWIMKSLSKCENNKSRAARELGLSRVGLEKMMARLKME